DRDWVGYDREERYEGSEGGIRADLTKGTIKDTFGDTDKVKGSERISGTSRDDIFIGGAKNDRFDGLDGTDSFNGKAGIDAVAFNGHDIDHGVNVDLSLGSGQIIDDGYGNTENATSIEAVSGSRFDDTIKLG